MYNSWEWGGGYQRHSGEFPITSMQRFLADLAMLVQVVKNERNKTHSQILVMQQVNAELADKSKILANEIDILHAKAVDQDKWGSDGGA